MPEPDLRSGMKEVLGSEFTEMLCVGRPHMGLGQLPGGWRIQTGQEAPLYHVGVQ